MSHPRSRVLGGVLLVAGTTIGAGMLALPVSTGLAGFYPSLALFFGYWVFMTYTAFLFLEVNLWFPGDINFVTMAEKTIGFWGKLFAWAFYMFLLYALTTAYIAAGGPLFIDFVAAISGIKLPMWFGPFPLLLIFGYFVYKGTAHVDGINRFMMCGLAISYLVVVCMLAPDVDVGYLEHVEWKYLPIGVSLAAVSFGFHIIIPSLTTYLDHDLKRLVKTIFLGSIFPVLVYILWDFVSLGTIPLEGENGITQGYIQGISGAALLTAISENNPIMNIATRCLAFFAIITSFLGVSLSLLDFLADGTGIEKTRSGRATLILMTFVPPLFFALNYSRAFFSALEYAGAFGVVTLLGLLPALMVWFGRYRRGYKSAFVVPGGKPALIAAMVVSLLVVLIEIGNKLGWVQV